jgi:predicted DNA binding protein
MVTAKLAIELDDSLPIPALSRTTPGTRFRHVSCIVEDDGECGLALLEVESEIAEEVLSALESHPLLRDFEVLERSPNGATCRYETDVSYIYHVVRDAEIIPVFPYTVCDGILFFETTTTPERLSRFSDGLAERDINFDVTMVTTDAEASTILTPRQRQFVRAALERGYYDDPRRCSLTDLATEQGVATSTASRILHRAESRVMQWFADERLRPGVDIE